MALYSEQRTHPLIKDKQGGSMAIEIYQKISKPRRLYGPGNLLKNMQLQTRKITHFYHLAANPPYLSLTMLTKLSLKIHLKYINIEYKNII